MNDNFDSDVVTALKAAGWYPGRLVDISALEQIGTELFPAARSVLKEFYGLHIGTCGPGKECATSDIRVDPMLASDDIKEFPNDEQGRRVKLFALGDFCHSHGDLLIDEMGRIYFTCEGEPILFAKSFDDALLKAVKGLRPDQAIKALLPNQS